MTRLLIIIPAILHAAAEAFAKQFDPNSQTYTQELYAAADEEQAEPSHYWISALCSEATVQTVRGAVQAGHFPGGIVETYDLRANPGFPDAKLAELQLRRKLPLKL